MNKVIQFSFIIIYDGGLKSYDRDYEGYYLFYSLSNFRHIGIIIIVRQSTNLIFMSTFVRMRKLEYRWVFEV